MFQSCCRKCVLNFTELVLLTFKLKIEKSCSLSLKQCYSIMVAYPFTKGLIRKVSEA